MQFTLLSQKTLAGIPSASGIEIIGNALYVMGDDSPWVFRLNEKWEVVEKTPVSSIPATQGEKIPKQLKPDLEAMASMGPTLLLFGSGSKSPQRDVLICLDTDRSHDIKKYSLVQFYDSLCVSANLTRKELNIEAAVILNEDLFLFNRGKNRVFKLNIHELLAHTEGNRPAPVPEAFRVTLPSLKGIEAGFSGAAVTPDSKQILFTASVENTPNWIDDGEILGSFIGLFPLSGLKDSLHPDCIAITDGEKNTLNIKVESIAVRKQVSTGKLHLLLVTDNDGTTSELIEAELTLTP